MTKKNEDEKLLDLDRYFREIDIKLYGGNNIIEAFDRMWGLACKYDLFHISFTSNERKVTIEKIKT